MKANPKYFICDYINSSIANKYFFKLEKTSHVSRYFSDNCSLKEYGNIYKHSIVFAGMRFFNLEYLNTKHQEAYGVIGYEPRGKEGQVGAKLSDFYDSPTLSRVFAFDDISRIFRTHENIIKDQYTIIVNSNNVVRAYGLYKEMVNDNFKTMEEQIKEQIDNMNNDGLGFYEKELIKKGAFLRLKDNSLSRFRELITENIDDLTKTDIYYIVIGFTENFVTKTTLK